MNPTYTWDAPGLTFDSGLTWDSSPTPTPTPQTMSKFKAYTSFTRYDNANLQVLAGSIHEQMAANAASFVNPPITLEAFATQVASFTAALLTRTTRAAAAVVELQDQRQAMLSSLRILGNYVNDLAQGANTLLVLSGFPYYNTLRPPLNVPPLPPTNVRLSRGTASGIIIVRCTPAVPQALNEVQISLNPTPTEETWQDRGTFYHGRTTLTGFSPGIIVTVRVRTVGRKDMLSDWSETSQIRTL